MFNYQSELYSKVIGTWQRLNMSSEGMLDRLDKVILDRVCYTGEVLYWFLPDVVKNWPLPRYLYSEWKMFYAEAYKWIYPRMTEFSNTTLHYGSGVSIGILASILILFFIIARFLPDRLKSIGYLLMIFGTSASLWLFTSVTNFFTDPLTETFVQNWQLFIGYIVLAGILSFAVVYRYGPVSDERTLNLIQWFLQFIGLVLVYNSTQIREVSIALILILLVVYNFPRGILVNERSRNFWYRFFPPKIKLLTEEEYIRQGNIETKKELDKLRDYCRSPDCQAWKIISKLKSPHRFADFIMNGTWHISEV